MKHLLLLALGSCPRSLVSIIDAWRVWLVVWDFQRGQGNPESCAEHRQDRWGGGINAGMCQLSNLINTVWLKICTGCWGLGFY
jgi:hypothetical protein